jgi:hypothetical protein
MKEGSGLDEVLGKQGAIGTHSCWRKHQTREKANSTWGKEQDCADKEVGTSSWLLLLCLPSSLISRQLGSTELRGGWF